MQKSLFFIPIFLLMIASLFLWWLMHDEPEEIRASISPAEQLREEAEGYLRATGPREFTFPEDHGPHPGFRTEWWYYTGNLRNREGREFGYQFTIFRNLLNPPGKYETERASNWASNDLMLGHVAIIDIENETHYYEERRSRSALGLAGAQSPPFRVWLEDWVAEYSGKEQENQSGATTNMHGTSEGSTPMQLRAATDKAGFELTLTPEKPLVMHGDRGFDRKGPDSGQATFYLAFTRMATEGTLYLHNDTFRVEGLSWMDHEWSTSALAENQAGWDWFSIQLNNGYDLMFYEIRTDDGKISPYTTATLVTPEGETRHYTHGDLELTPRETWTSTYSKGEYPVKWDFSLPAEDIELTIQTRFPDQEMQLSVLYYEGAIIGNGTHAGNSVEGSGFVEMTGYGDNLAGRGD